MNLRCQYRMHGCGKFITRTTCIFKTVKSLGGFYSNHVRTLVHNICAPYLYIVLLFFLFFIQYNTSMMIIIMSMIAAIIPPTTPPTIPPVLSSSLVSPVSVNVIWVLLVHIKLNPLPM